MTEQETTALATEKARAEALAGLLFTAQRDLDAARARLAEVEAERDKFKGSLAFFGNDLARVKAERDAKAESADSYRAEMLRLAAECDRVKAEAEGLRVAARLQQEARDVLAASLGLDDLASPTPDCPRETPCATVGFHAADECQP